VICRCGGGFGTVVFERGVRRAERESAHLHKNTNRRVETNWQKDEESELQIPPYLEKTTKKKKKGKGNRVDIKTVINVQAKGGDEKAKSRRVRGGVCREILVQSNCQGEHSMGEEKHMDIEKEPKKEGEGTS